jgi:DNA polymerase-4
VSNERIILHSDLNAFYASVECLYNPQIRIKPVAVCGSTDQRHGIVLAKNDVAKKFGLVTGEAVWQAKQKCPELVTVAPNFDRYMKFSRETRKIYERYSDRIESFGLDECWIDCTGCVSGNGESLAYKIRDTIKNELGITASVGVSWNKIFAKLGSNMKNLMR